MKANIENARVEDRDTVQKVMEEFRRIYHNASHQSYAYILGATYLAEEFLTEAGETDKKEMHVIVCSPEKKYSTLCTTHRRKVSAETILKRESGIWYLDEMALEWTDTKNAPKLSELTSFGSCGLELRNDNTEHTTTEHDIWSHAAAVCRRVTGTYGKQCSVDPSVTCWHRDACDPGICPKMSSNKGGVNCPNCETTLLKLDGVDVYYCPDCWTVYDGENDVMDCWVSKGIRKQED